MEIKVFVLTRMFNVPEHGLILFSSFHMADPKTTLIIR